MSTETGYTNVDGFLWFTNPGDSGGSGPGCSKGAPPTAVFWPARVVGLVQNADFKITGPQEHLQHDGPVCPTTRWSHPTSRPRAEPAGRPRRVTAIS